jgi:MYXO-CTERM domain-containing protein
VVPTDSTLLINGQTYLVQVQAIDKVGNAGACSNTLSGTPQVINDFWRLYKADGGKDLGGCGHAGSSTAVFGLVGALVLLGFRRRKDATR